MKEDRIWLLISKKCDGDITEEEITELENLLQQSKETAFTRDILNEIWKARLNVADTIDVKNSWRNIENKLSCNVPAKKQLPALKHWMMAASVLILVTAGIFLFHFDQNKKTTIAAEKSTNQIFTQYGSRSKIVLPDGTQVWLNSGSKLTYADFNGKQTREVQLCGEAFFNVVHDADHPFIIHTQKIDIKDIGTSFEVKAYPKDKTIEATLISGAIEITSHADPQRKIILKPNEKIIIPVNDSLTSKIKPTIPDSTTTTLYTIAQVKKDHNGLLPETAWVQNKLVFDNETFEDLAPKMEKWYNVNVIFKNDDLKAIRFSGIIEKETIDQALKGMQFSYPFEYEIKGNDVFISK